MQVVIPVHSFMDVVTNSSSETFVTVDEKALKTIKEILNALLTAGGSKKTVEDLFTFELLNVKPWDFSDEDWNEEDIGPQPNYNKLIVKAKDPKNTAAAACLTALQTTFEAETLSSEG